ncbi:RidA family protein [Musicola paradisiaca]|uniref:Endoribonuclease L-PSP n=1 Tax=Musicola paradisiaca (strain Ech703) TaxID=579405 RepID=C6C7N2_MUSP7|nr:RidA family protein [Musicola paradisiaca]ACS85974.1 Endoribonuclease L-PSP [Musicola paradisiaca Ech703]
MMIMRAAPHTKDDTCPACVVAGGFIFLAHHSGGHEKADAVFQARASLKALSRTLQSVDASLNDMVQLTLYLKHRQDFPAVRDVFREFFTDGHYPARMTVFTDFISENCLCMMDGTAVVASSPDAQ